MDFSEWTQPGHENSCVLNESLPKVFPGEGAQGSDEYDNLPLVFYLSLLQDNISKVPSKKWSVTHASAPQCLSKAVIHTTSAAFIQGSFYVVRSHWILYITGRAGILLTKRDHSFKYILSIHYISYIVSDT